MARPEKIKLGQQEFDILPMNIATLEEVEEGFAMLGTSVPGRARFQAYMQILLAGIQTCKPDFTIDALKRIPAVEKHQISAAVDAIARVSGMAAQPDEHASNEGNAAAAS